jgi:Ino eighty subunit 1
MTDDGGRSPGGSTITASEMDDHTIAYPSSPIHADPDPRASLQHVLGHPEQEESASKPSEMVEEDEDRTPGGTAPPGPAATTSRKKKEKDPAPGSALNSAIYSGNKVRHLKKDDGEPLWRADIQYDFLKYIFEDDKKVFTNSYDPALSMQTFADLYIDAMARSSKTSKILRDKLLSEHEPAKNMAMVCLLVNLGRMNTTLNCEGVDICSPLRANVA